MPGEEKERLEESIQDPPARRGGTLAVVLPILIVGAIGIWFWANRSGDTSSEDGGTRIKSTLHLETFVLNLADTDQRSYLRVGIDLGLTQEIKRGETVAPVAQIRDTILGVLSEAKVDELMTAAGKAKLKQDLLHALQERLPQQGVEEVYFTEFLIQR
jgi:flagellar basal body-associated protein FliL